MRRHGSALITGGMAAAVVLALASAHSTTLDIDEARYLAAAKLGIRKNALEAGSLSAVAFLEFAWSKLHAALPTFPAAYDEQRDPLLLRNWHPPLVVYLMTPVSQTTDERVLRSGQTLGAVVLVLLVAAAHRRISPATTWAGTATVGLLGLSACLRGFASLNTHGWMTVWAVLSVYSLAEWLRGGRWIWGLVCCGAVALGQVTLHTGILVFLGCLIAARLATRLFPTEENLPDQAHSTRYTLIGVLITGALTMALWPGGVIKLGYLKIFAAYGYLLYQGREWSQARHPYWPTLSALLPLVLLVPAAVVWLVRYGARRHLAWVPAAVVGLLYALPIVPHLAAPRYLLPALGPMIPLVGWFVDEQRSQARRWLVFSVAGMATLGSFLTLPTHDPVRDSAARTDLAWLASSCDERGVSAEWAEIYQHYLGPGCRVKPLFVDYDGRPVIRESVRYRPLAQGDTEGRRLVFSAHRPSYAAHPAFRGCAVTLRPTVSLYDCPMVPPADARSGKVEHGGSMLGPS